MKSKLILGDSIKILAEMPFIDADLIVFDPDNAMPNKDSCLRQCHMIASRDATLLFYGVNAHTIVRLVAQSPWIISNMIQITNDGQEIGVMLVATKGIPQYTLSALYNQMSKLEVGVKGEDAHPTTKGEEWFDIILDMCNFKHVLDPFMGLAYWGAACRKRGINFTGIEIDEEYFKLAEKNVLGTE